STFFPYTTLFRSTTCGAKPAKTVLENTPRRSCALHVTVNMLNETIRLGDRLCNRLSPRPQLLRPKIETDSTIRAYAQSTVGAVQESRDCRSSRNSLGSFARKGDAPPRVTPG